jgi:Zn finger protein HypA/HybF involved in hydrogenase expression
MSELDDDINRVAALCKDCKEVTSVNDYKETFQCHKCHGINVVLYRDLSLQETVHKPKRELKYSDVEHLDFNNFCGLPNYAMLDALFYLCSKCNEIKMRIVDGGIEIRMAVG